MKVIYRLDFLPNNLIKVYVDSSLPCIPDILTDLLTLGIVVTSIGSSGKLFLVEPDFNKGRVLTFERV